MLLSWCCYPDVVIQIIYHPMMKWLFLLWVFTWLLCKSGNVVQCSLSLQKFKTAAWCEDLCISQGWEELIDRMMWIEWATTTPPIALKDFVCYYSSHCQWTEWWCDCLYLQGQCENKMHWARLHQAQCDGYYLTSHYRSCFTHPLCFMADLLEQLTELSILHWNMH